MSAANYFDKKLLDQLTGVAAFSWPTLFLGLFTADPTVAGLLTSEVSASGYARLSLAGIMGAADATGFCVNTSLIAIGPAAANWGTVNFLGIVDTATLGIGNMIWPGVPSQPRTITTGQTFQIPAGQFRMRAA